MQKPSPFFQVVRKLLNERLKLFKAGIIPEFTDNKNFYYVARKMYLDASGLLEIPGYKRKSHYSNYLATIANWCKKHARDIGVDPLVWWQVRDKLNMEAKPKSICYSELGEFLIRKATRDKVSKGCSFILICEKEKVGRNLTAALRQKGYKVNLISAGGRSPGDVKQAIIDAVSVLTKENFFVLYLHDYDVAGAEMILHIKEHYSKVIDIGVNKQFIIKTEIDPELVEENVHIKTKRRKLTNRCKLQHYKMAYDLDYLLGSRIEGEDIYTRTGRAKRIEIDNVEVHYGLKPFLDYIEYRLGDIRCWDLTRIGMSELYLSEPDNFYKTALNNRQYDAQQAFKEKSKELSETLNLVLKTVKDTLTRVPEFQRLEYAYWEVDEDYVLRWRELKGEDLKNLNKGFEKQMNREWVKGYEPHLEEINEQIDCYDPPIGFNVTDGVDDLNEQCDDLQYRLDNAKEEDPDLKKYVAKLEEIDWGEDQLEDIVKPDPANDISEVITALQKLLVEHLDPYFSEHSET